jgi:hypothetical protein
VANVKELIKIMKKKFFIKILVEKPLSIKMATKHTKNSYDLLDPIRRSLNVKKKVL